MTPRTGTAERPLVLNVNDHDGVRYMTSRILRQAGFAVADAATGGDALEVARERRPRLVVLDIKLPDVSGLEVCERLKNDPVFQAPKVLHTSGVFVTAESKVRSLESGADGYLSHPFEQEELVATVRSLLRLQDAEQELRDTAAELQDANRRTHEFLAMLAHELRNPLSAITSSLPLLARHEARDDAERLARGVVQRQTTQLRRLVDDLLDVARVTQGKIDLKFEPVDLVPLLARVVDNFRRTRTDARRQRLDLDAGALAGVRVSGDPVRLEQVFSNLLDNASKYSGEGRRIGVIVRPAPDDEVAVTVEDEGIGIAPEELPSIFNLFSQAEVSIARSGGGLGIGLTLVQTLTTQHGGRVAARSDGVGRGCALTVTLPVLREPATTGPDERRGGDERVSSPGLRIVLVEDNDDARESLRLLLELWGHHVTTAGDGLTGVRTVVEQAPDVALIDVGLPLLDGYSVARRAREALGAGTLLVALTGYGASMDRQLAQTAGFDRHLVKPVDADDLRGLLAAWAEGRVGPGGRPGSVSRSAT